MRVWNKPELAEVNINETANGLLPFGVEVCIISHDFDCSKEKEKEKEVTPPTDPKKTVNEWS